MTGGERENNTKQKSKQNKNKNKLYQSPPPYFSPHLFLFSEEGEGTNKKQQTKQNKNTMYQFPPPYFFPHFFPIQKLSHEQLFFEGNKQEQKMSDKKVFELDKREKIRNKYGFRPLVCFFSEIKIKNKSLNGNPISFAPPLFSFPSSPRKNVFESFTEGNGKGQIETGRDFYQRTNSNLFPDSPCSSSSLFLPRNADRVPLGGNFVDNERNLGKNFNEGSNIVLEKQNKNIKREYLFPSSFRTGPTPLSHKHVLDLLPVENFHRRIENVHRNEQFLEERKMDKGNEKDKSKIEWPLDQADSSIESDSLNKREKPLSISPSSFSQTQKSKFSFPRGRPSLHFFSNPNCANGGFGDLDSTPLVSFPNSSSLLASALRERAISNVKFFLLTRHRINKLPTASQVSSLPLHSKPVKPLLLLNLLKSKILQTQTIERIQFLFSSLTSLQPGTCHPPRLKMKQAHAHQMVDDKIIDPVFSIPPTPLFVDSFLVLEEAKQRLRQIHWPKIANECLDYKSQFTLRSTLEKKLLFTSFLSSFPSSQAVSLDLISGFYQIELPTDDFILQDDGGCFYKLNRLPMGLNCAPEILQILLHDIVSFCSKKCSNFVFDVHIDNVLFLSPDPSPFLQEISRIASEYHLSFSPSPHGYIFENEVDHCGILFNLQANSVRLRDTLQAKAQRDLSSLSNDVPFTFLESAMGRILFAASILPLSLDLPSSYFGLKKYRRLLSLLRKGSFQPSSIVHLPNSLFSLLHRCLTVMQSNVPEIFSPKPTALRHFTLFTDASLQGFGFVLHKEGGEIVTGGQRWETEIQPRDMCVAELCAVFLGISQLRHLFASPCSVHVFVDNTSALRVAVGTAKSDSMRFVKCHLQELFSSLPCCSFSFQYINTKLNEADFFSRNF